MTAIAKVTLFAKYNYRIIPIDQLTNSYKVGAFFSSFLISSSTNKQSFSQLHPSPTSKQRETTPLKLLLQSRTNKHPSNEQNNARRRIRSRSRSRSIIIIVSNSNILRIGLYVFSLANTKPTSLGNSIQQKVQLLNL